MQAVLALEPVHGLPSPLQQQLLPLLAAQLLAPGPGVPPDPEYKHLVWEILLPHPPRQVLLCGPQELRSLGHHLLHRAAWASLSGVHTRAVPAAPAVPAAWSCLRIRMARRTPLGYGLSPPLPC